MSKAKLSEYISPEKRSLISGPFGSSISSKYFVESGVPVIRGNNLTFDSQKFLDRGFAFITQEKADELNAYALPGDIVFTAAGTIGQVGLITDKLMFKKYTISNKQIRARLDESKIDINFAYYILNSEYVRKQIINSDTGSTIPLINLSIIRDIDMPKIEIKTQRKIAAVLSALDDKIELNRLINAELEQMARTLYDYWFVQFDFPNKQGKPYKSSGGPLKHSKELNRPIPTDWEVLKLEDRLVFDKGTEPGASAYSDTKDDENDTTFYRVGDIDGNSSTYINASLFKPKLVSSSDVIVTFDGSVGKIGIGLDGAISGGLRHIYDKEGKISNATIYSIFRNEYIQKTIERYATGSVILHASSSIKYLAIPFDEKVVTEFQKITQPLFDKIIANRQQSQNLAHLRDWLLPMLMNGQVSVE
jgi:type I restriction enzyme S subunit